MSKVYLLFQSLQDEQPKDGKEVIIMTIFKDEPVIEGIVHNDMVLVTNRTPVSFEYIKMWAYNNLRK